MIERKIIKKKLSEYAIKAHIEFKVGNGGYSHTDIHKTPLGENIIIHTSTPGRVVGSKGKNIRELTEELKRKFNLENPQIKVNEIERPYLNPNTIARDIVSLFERFGPRRFTFTGYKMLNNIMKAGAKGAEIILSGRGIPSVRSKTWKFSAGHLKKSGDVSENKVLRSTKIAHLKSGSIGVKVKILTPDVELPDEIKIKEPIKEEVEEKEVKEEKEVPKTIEKEPKTKKEKVPTAKELAEKKIKEDKDGNNKTK
jgi:small subunit ribosomal protein S3